MDLNSTLQKQENFANDRQDIIEPLSMLTPSQVMVCCKVKMSHKERQDLLKTRVYYKSREALRDAVVTSKVL